LTKNSNASTLYLMSILRQLCFAFVAAVLLLSGCSSPEMKGTPFYSGEYELNVPDADMRRVNLWPLTYYREPALSVLWPVYERTEEHIAVRPFFSAYGSTNSYWEYNLLWPLCQADRRGQDYRIFPYYWGKAGQSQQSYHVLFPFVWHYENETSALFPLYIYDHEQTQDAPTDRDFWLLWPLLRHHRFHKGTEWHVTLVGDYHDLETDERYTGYPWPLLFSWRSRDTHGLFTPFYAYEDSDKPDVRDGWDALPLLLSWRSWKRDSRHVTAGLGLYHQTRRGDARSGWLLPFCAYDTQDRLLLTPLVGWDKPDERDPDGYWYPFTPLGGVRTGAHRGGWLFPLFNHTADATNDTYHTSLMLLGHAEHRRKSWREGSSDYRSLGLFPLFRHSAYTSTTSNPKSHSTVESAYRFDSQLLLRWSGTTDTTSRSQKNPPQPENDYKMTFTESGLFPLWSAESRTKTRLDGSPLSRTDEKAILGALYDTKRNTVMAQANTPALDYIRRRVLWRVWHYERRNSDVSVDLFPFITHDTHADGFRKTSFLWRFYRYEKSPEGKTALDLFFLPLIRNEPRP
jgi:hypothetical protein